MKVRLTELIKDYEGKPLEQDEVNWEAVALLVAQSANFSMSKFRTIVKEQSTAKKPTIKTLIHDALNMVPPGEQFGLDKDECFRITAQVMLGQKEWECSTEDAALILQGSEKVHMPLQKGRLREAIEQSDEEEPSENGTGKKKTEKAKV